MFESRAKNIALAIGVAAGASVIGVALALKVRRRRKVGKESEMFAELQKKSVHIKDKERVHGLIEELVRGGKDRLQVIADFDKTLSRYKLKDGTVNHTCHNVLDQSDLLPEESRQSAFKIRDQYLAIETDPNMTIEEKKPYMVEWWTKAHELLVECAITQDNLKKTVKESGIKLRDGNDWLFQQLNKHGVPMLIFSAGVGDVIEEAVRLEVGLTDNVKIVSNYMDFNHQGVLVGFKGELIHSFNKNENAIHDSNYFQDLLHRDNLVLLGDSLGDLRMADGCEVSNLLKIGFLNDKVEQLLPAYMNSFDIVLVQDESMDVPNALLKRILS